MVSRPWPRLTHTRVEPQIADQFLRSLKALDIANSRLESKRHNHVDAGDRHQPFDALIGQSRAGKVPLDRLQVLAKTIELTE
jgi:hypothetical protein